MNQATTLESLSSSQLNNPNPPNINLINPKPYPLQIDTPSPPFQPIDANQAGLLVSSSPTVIPSYSCSPFDTAMYDVRKSSTIIAANQERALSAANQNRGTPSSNKNRVKTFGEQESLLISKQTNSGTVTKNEQFIQTTQQNQALKFGKDDEQGRHATDVNSGDILFDTFDTRHQLNAQNGESSPPTQRSTHTFSSSSKHYPGKSSFFLNSHNTINSSKSQTTSASLDAHNNWLLDGRSLSYPSEKTTDATTTADSLFTRSFSNDQGGAPHLVFATDEEAPFYMESEKLKVRFLSAWNNVKNGWTFGKKKASFTSPHPIWLLGVKYDSKGSSTDSLEENNTGKEFTAALINESSLQTRPLQMTKDDAAINAASNAFQQLHSVNDNIQTSGITSCKQPAEKTRRRSSSLGEEITEQSASLQNFAAFKLDFLSRMWFTYRKDFPALPETKSTSDTGWGCMLRSGQMMLAQAFLLHFLTRDWRFQGKLEQQGMYLQVLRWFDDSAGLQAPFSLHTLVDIGTRSGKNVGDWYGPSSVAYVLRDALDCAKQKGEFELLQNLSIYVAQDCTVYKNDVMQQCFSDQNDNLGAIILVPVRLGGDYFNPAYSPVIQDLFHWDNCLGIIGGKPRHSLYFVGYQKEKLLYLDPHFCQTSVDMRGTYFPTESFRCNYPRKMGFSKMDPSCTLGFYCRDRYEFMRFCFQMTPTSMQRGEYPMFVISSSSYEAVMNTVTQVRAKKEKILRVHHLDPQGNATTQAEDFVFLEVKASADLPNHHTTHP